MTSEIAPHIRLDEPALSFHPERSADADVHPLRGLLQYGPYSSGFVPNPIRIATISPYNESERLYGFMRDLNSTFRPRERREYLPEWPGFRAVFDLKMGGAGGACHHELDESLEESIQTSPTPHVVLAEALMRAIHDLEPLRNQFDILFIYLPQRWSPCFSGGDEEDFDLHDYLKASTAQRKLPIQVIREDKALDYFDRASVMWRIGLAIYVKAGGVPWKLADVDPEAAYIGISYALRRTDSNQPRFVTCCSQVFDAEGAGLEFIAYNAQEVRVQRDNPFLSRTEMFRVMTRSMDLYRRRHAGRTPRRVMVHKSTEFRSDEIDGCMEALHLCESVDLLQVVRDVAWRGVLINAPRGDQPKGEPAAFPIARGSLIGLSQEDALLWSHGNVDQISERGSYFQGSRGTPQPIRLVRFAGHGSWNESASAVLALTKMNWNNDNLYDSLPVTMSYASVLARVMKRFNKLDTTPYQFRFFM